MSNRVGTRSHPYRRGRQVGVSGQTRRRSASSGQVRRRDRQLTNMANPTGSTSSSDNRQEASASTVTSGGCIDLTANDSMEDVIDLTSPVNTAGSNVHPVVVISSLDVGNADAHRRGRGRHRLPPLVTEDDVIEVVRDARPDVQVSSSPSRVASAITLDDSDDDDLPDVPFSTPKTAESPGTTKITCPVCMDSDAQIRRSQRHLCSTTCGHIFCCTCIKQAVAIQRKCPTCRKTLGKRQIHPIFL